ncbi:hypothetical protein C8J36_103519 [Rhizobium sp. PP-F2F-G48]|uniref:hypothetical protein n=1 Tax=Rhizobium sp. PP-F2F-G48 TaxID=2135651 RepID=UPI001053D1FE|nr:hypothetical protein [Rhizobium sp. PP-F2F-G48]TCM56149.1 hypothetical protein C8J36_103519 [Rhizobium sp. PP-F2F-G48]
MPAAIVGFIAAIGVPGLVTATGALTTIGSIVAGGIGLGLSYAANALFGAKPSTVKPQDGKGTLRQSVAPRRKHYGRVRTGGSYVLFRTKQGNLFQVIYIGEGRCDAFEEHYIDGRPVTPDPDGWIRNKQYEGKVRVVNRRGLPVETAYSELIENFPEVWTAAHRGDGCVSAFIHARGVKQEKFNSVYPNRIPAYESVRRDGVVYDPRSATNGWTANLYLIFRDYLISNDGAGISAAYIDDADFAAAATLGDEILPTNGGGTVRRCHGQLSYTLETEPVDIIDRLETATDGRLILKPNGKIGIQPGRWVEPTVSIADGHLIDYELSDSSGPLREANEVTVKYTNPLAAYTEATSDPWRDEDDISQTGRVRAIPIEAYEIQNHHHARRVAKLKFCRASARWRGSIITDLYGLKARNERFIRVQVLDLGIDFEAFEVESFEEDDDTMTIKMTIASRTADMYQLPSSEEGTPPVVPPTFSEEDLDMPTGVLVVGSQRVVSGQGKVALITATWAPYPDRDDLNAEVQISPADQEKWSAITVDDSQTRAEAIGLADGQLYDVRIRWVKPGGTPSTWAIVENIPALADPDKPATPLQLKTVLAGATVTVSARAANDNSAYLVFKRGTASQTFAQATDISGNIRVTANQVIEYADTPGPGTWRYWCSAKNPSGLLATTPAGPTASVVVT